MSLLIELVDRLRMWLELREKYNAQRDERYDEALLAVHQASNKTRAYLADVRANVELLGRDREAELSESWVRVGDRLRRLHDADADPLSERCFLKGEFWADPNRWDDAELEQAGIGLDNLTREVGHYIRGPAGPPRRR